MEGESKLVFNWKNIGVVLVFVLVIFLGFVYISRGVEAPENNTQDLNIDDISENDLEGGVESLDSIMNEELQSEDLVVGEGTEAEPGKRVTVNYKGTLTDGTQFDSSYDRGVPFTFELGAGEVIPGWDFGVAGMKVGGKRKLTIPSQMAYGERGTEGIPPNSTLVFEIELLGVEQ